VTKAELLAYCLAKPGAWPDEPWEGDTVVKVGDKVFAFLGADDGDSVGLKCGRTAEEAGEWRSRYRADVTVTPYIGRYGWNTFAVGGDVPDAEIYERIDASYDDVVSRLPKAKRPKVTT
jgi:predicted DNA-binding protein (MmcQ/YjbR family)